MIQMTLARIVKVLEFTAMITQTNWIEDIVIDTIWNDDIKSIFIWSYTSRCHSYSSQLQYGFTADECQAWTNYENNGN